MISKNFYKSSVAPEMFHKIELQSHSIEIWITTCIVTNFGKGTVSNCSVLINPSNPELTGVSKFPYFPRGGPVPTKNVVSMHKSWQPLGYVSNWGGMEVTSGMLYPVSVVDGLVHLYGGTKLQAECYMKRMWAKDNKPCPIGKAIRTSSGSGDLSKYYDSIIHTTPPFFNHDSNPNKMLKLCYRNAISEAFDNNNDNIKSNSERRVACPLLGAGARGFPEEVAIEIAASEALRWGKEVKDTEPRFTLAFGLLEHTTAQNFANATEQSKIIM